MSVDSAKKALDEHRRRYSGDILRVGSWAGEEFDRLYTRWIRARWDDRDAWVRDVWKERP